MKKITFCFTLMVLLISQGYSQISLGDGTSTGKHVPFEPSFSYSYGQSIYLASEISATGVITSLQWYFAGSSLQYSAITVYLGHTAKSEFSTNEDWESADNLVQAYSGPITANGPGWVNITLQMPFDYNGTDNLVVAVKETLIGADAPDADFSAYQVSTRRSLSAYGDSDPFDENFPPYADYRGNYVPNVILGNIMQVCPFPINVAVSDITTSSLSLTWESAGAVSSGGTQYYISDSDINPTILTAPTGNVSSGDLAAVVSGLNPGTVYKVWVRDVCEGSPGNWSPPVSFVTACLPVASFNENFDTTDSGLPLCWSSILRGPTVDLSLSAHVDVVSYEGHSGYSSVELFKDYPSAVDDFILVSPAVNNLPTHRVKFFARTTGDISHLIIGTLDGNSIESNFSQFSNEIEITPYYTEYVIDFTDYEGTDSHIGFRMQDNSGSASIYIDDIRWELTPPCPDVAEIAVPTTTPATANITWNGEGETEWKLVYATSDIQDPTGLTPVTVLTTPAKIIEGLSENTSYNVWVSSVCNEGQGLWTGPVTFTTPCTAISQFNENFDTAEAPELPSCWTKLVRGNGIGDSYIGTDASDLYSAPNAVVINTSYPADGVDVILVSPNLQAIGSIDHRLKFFAKTENSSGTLQIGTLNSNTADAVFTPFQDVAISGNATHYTIDLSDYDGTDSYIGIRAGNVEPTKYIIDNIEWSLAPTCKDPVDLSVSELSASAATLQWSAGDSEAQWQIAYGPSTILYPEDSTISDLLGSPTLEINSLIPNTKYNIWVRSVCSGSNGDWVGPVVFTTPCIPSTYLNENFDAVTAPALPGCWSSIIRGQGVSAYAQVGTVNYYLSPSLSNSVQITNAGSEITDQIILVSPKLSNLPNATNRLKFYAKRNAAAAIQIGTLDNNNPDTAIFSNFGTAVGLTNDYALYTVDFTAYTGTDTYIGIRIKPEEASYASVYIDNVIWETAPACADLTALSVTGTTVSTADIAWSAGNGTSQAQVVYGAASVNDPDTLVAGPLLTTNSTQLTGLESNTEYRFWVRSVCIPGGNGAWIGPIEFSTKCLSGSIPYTEDFEGLLAPNLPNCSSFLNAGLANNWNTSDYPYGDFETICLTYGGSNVNANAWFFTQGLNLEQGTNYKIAFDYGKGGFDDTESLRVMYGTSADVAGMTLPLVDLAEVTNSLPMNSTTSFTAPTTGIYYFGFNAYSQAGQEMLIVDNISVDFMLSNGDFSNDNFSYYPNPVKNTLNLSYTKNISNVSVYTILGQKVIENTINANNTQMDMSQLSRGTYIVKVTSDNQTKTIKVVKQ